MPRPIENGNDDRRRRSNKDSFWSMEIEKHNVLNEVRSFDNRYLDKTRISSVIKKLLYLLNQGETFTKSEAASIINSVISSVYFFQDAYFRRMLHLIARELCPVAQEDTSDLLRVILLGEINNRDVPCRARAIRLLFLIPNVKSSSDVVVKCLKLVLRERKPLARISGVVCAINLIKSDPWWRDTLEPMLVTNIIEFRGKHVHYQSLYLLFQINRHDLVLRTSKWANIYRRSLWSTSSWGCCILARAIGQVARDLYVGLDPDYYKFLRSCIYGKNELVAIEGFRSLAAVRGITSTQLNPAVDVIRRIHRASKKKPVLMFATMRTLQKVWVSTDKEIIEQSFV